MKALIVDDEEPARLEMHKLLSVHPEVLVVGEAADVDTALEITDITTPDIVFLDIQLAGESGFEYAGRVRDFGPRIVFVTAYDRYALCAFECNALDYLLKPVHPERLAETLRRVHPKDRQLRPATEDDAIFIKTGSAARFVPWREIQLIATSGNYTRLYLSNGSNLLILRPLKEWLALAPVGSFLQVHRML